MDEMFRKSPTKSHTPAAHGPGLSDGGDALGPKLEPMPELACHKAASPFCETKSAQGQKV